MIEVRNIQKTEIEKEALLKLINKFSKFEKDLYISFDSRLKDFGDYSFDSEKRRHHIRISNKKYTPDKKSVYKFKNRVPEMLATLLHELKHLMQQEELGTNVLFGKRFSCNKNIKNDDASDYYSLKEVEARQFEDENILGAIDFYCKSVESVIE